MEETKDAQDEIEKKIEEILQKKLDQILQKEEEVKRKQEELQKKRVEYVKKIWSYFPGAKTKTLTFEEIKEIAEKLDDLAAKLKYTPVLPKSAKSKFFGDKKGRNKRITLIAFLVVLLGIAVYIKTFVWGW